MRLLGITRLSDFKDESLSVEQQQQMQTDYAKAHGHTIVAFVDDTDISGDYGPFHPKRSIADWLNNRQSEYDGIIFRAINRVARNAEQTLRLIRWAEHRGKVLISIKDGIDTTTEAGRTMAKFMAIVAEMELDQIKSRAKDAHRYITQVARRWPGMQCPFGYVPVKVDNGWKLEPDPVYAPILVQMADRFLDGESFGQIARWLNDEGIPTSRNIARIRSGKEPTKTRWTTDTVSKILKSPAMIGAIVTTEVLERDDETNKVTRRSDPKPLYDDDGNLVLRAEPIVSYDRWSKIQARISSNPQVSKPHVKASPLLHIAYCGTSGDPMYFSRVTYPQYGRVNRYYVCAKSSNRSSVSAAGRCDAKRFSAELLEEIIPEMVLDAVGSVPHMTPDIKPAQEYSSALAQVNDAITNLLEALEAGAFKGRMDVFQTRMSNLEARRDELAAKPSRPEETTWVTTGQTVSEYFNGLAPDAQWDYLRAMHVRAFVDREGRPDSLPMPDPTGRVVQVIDPDSELRVTIHLGAMATLRELAARLQ